MRRAHLVTEDTEFDLRFSPDVRLVSTVRTFLTELCAHVLESEEATSKIAVTTHELLENAVHYSADGRAELVVRLKTTPTSTTVAIETQNRATPERIALARHALDEVLAADDPTLFYLALMRRAARRTHVGSGLGLGRIRAESDLAVSYIIEDDHVTIRARGVLPTRSQSGQPPPEAS